MSQSKQSTLAAEVEKRLDTLFQEEDNQGPEDQTIEGLKAVILSMEWEISDRELNTLLSISEDLKKKYKGDKLLFPFAQLFNSLGRYIDKYRSKADPEAIKLLSSAFEAFDKALNEDSLPQKEKKKLLKAQVDRFKELKKRIQATKKTKAPSAKRKKAAKVKEEVKPVQETALLVEEIRKMIREEFEALKKDLIQAVANT